MRQPAPLRPTETGAVGPVKCQDDERPRSDTGAGVAKRKRPIRPNVTVSRSSNVERVPSVAEAKRWIKELPRLIKCFKDLKKENEDCIPEAKALDLGVEDMQEDLSFAYAETAKHLERRLEEARAVLRRAEAAEQVNSSTSSNVSGDSRDDHSSEC